MVLSRRRSAVALALAGGLCLGWGLYLPAKARLGQALLRLAWARSVADGEPHRPWPWATTVPVARLRVERLGVDEVVLAGSTGASLAWAPGLMEAGSSPGDSGNVALAGHRDTVFRFLRDVEDGDLLTLDAGDGGARRYRVVRRRVVDESDLSVLAPTAAPTLTLITCYPFDTLVPGGRWRFVVQAEEGWQSAQWGGVGEEE